MVRDEKAFAASLPAGYDGRFDWDYLDGCFGETKIMPMDWDGVVERKGNFIVFETKNIGAQIPQGQLITLERAWRLGVFTIVFKWGKTEPERLEIWYPRGAKKIYEKVDKAFVRDRVKAWYQWADRTPATRRAEIQFLNRRVLHLEEKIEKAQVQLTAIANLLNQCRNMLGGQTEDES